MELKADSLVEKCDISNYNSKLKSKENKIIDKQDSIIKKVEKLTGKKVVNQSALLVNSFSIDAKRKYINKIAKINGIEKVYEASKVETTMANAVHEGNVANVWNSSEYGYTGEGTVVAVVDTGVNYKHKDMVLDKGVNTKFTKEQWEEKIKLLGYGKYCSDKVPFGYDYSLGRNDCLTEGNLHGYHVAGITSANGEVVGVVKNAQI